MLSALRSQYVIISMYRNWRGLRPTCVNEPAFAVKVIQSEKDLLYYALCNGHGEIVLPGGSKSFQARA